MPSELIEPPVAPATAPAPPTASHEQSAAEIPKPNPESLKKHPNIANLKQFFGARKPKPEAKPEVKLAEPGDEPPAPEKPKQEPPPKKEPEPEAKPKKVKSAVPEPRQPAPPSQIDLEAVAEAAGRGAAAGVAKAAPKPAPEPKPEDDLTPDEKAIAEVYERMGELSPSNKGLKDRYVQSLKRQSEYETKWLADHPGETFDANDGEHEAFFTKNEVEYDDRQFQIAAGDLAADRKTSKLKEDFDSHKSEIEREKQARELEPRLLHEQRKAGREYFEMLEDPEFDHSKIIGADLMANKETLDKLRASNELKANIYLHHAEAAEVTSRAAFALMTGVTKFNEKDPIHLEVNNTMAEFESAMATAQPQDRLDEAGREFKPWGEYHQMPKTQRNRYWTETPDQIYKVVAAKHAFEAKDLYQKQAEFVEKTAKSLGYVKNGSPAAAKPSETSPDPTPSSSTYKPKSPSATVDANHGPGPKASVETPKSGFARFKKSF